jgi:hypothetical protein
VTLSTHTENLLLLLSLAKTSVSIILTIACTKTMSFVTKVDAANSIGGFFRLQPKKVQKILQMWAAGGVYKKAPTISGLLKIAKLKGALC